MQDTIIIGKRLIPLEHIALAEPFDPAALEKIDSQRPFQTRLVLLDRSSVLTEEPLEVFAKAHGLRHVAQDGVALNPKVAFRVEAFEPAANFQPAKPFRSRLLWRDPQGQLQSRLMVSAPEDLLSVAVRTGASSRKLAGADARSTSSKPSTLEP